MKKHSMKNTNSIVLCGNIATDVETSGPFLKFNVAVNQYSNGQKTASFFPVEVFGSNLNDDVRSCLTKGHCIYIEGYFKTNEYTNKNGQKQYRDVIIAESVNTKTKGSFAYATICGILLADPRVRTTPSGKNVTEFRVGAAHNRVNKKINTWVHNPAYMGVYAWEPLGDFISKNFKQDSGIHVIGELVMNQFTAKDGTKRTTYRVKALTAKFLNDADDNQTATATPAQAAQPTVSAANYGGISAEDFESVDDLEDLPF